VYKYIKGIFFAFDAEKVHYAVMKILAFVYKLPFGAALLKKLYDVNDKNLYTTFLGIPLRNPIGLAAGFDKNAEYIDELATLGFGFIEIGTITPLPQYGNPKPRLFRLPQDEGIINRMGFNNNGVNAAVENLKRVKNKSIVIGGNIGKNKNTPNENAIHDYTLCFDKLYNYVHYFVINVSSPNTPGLRELQDKQPLTSIINALVERRKNKDTIKPILLKIAPDLNYDQLNDIAEIANNTALDGLVISNTTINRLNLKTDKESVDKLGAGGLSGKPLLLASNEILKYVRNLTSKPIIGVGGIVTGADAKSKIAAGADLLQVYTGFIYQGPGMIKDLCKDLSPTAN
jgi:dihydroorotate dehydrogenase